MNLPTPSQIVAYLERSVRGQKEAKRALALAIYHHHLGSAYRSVANCLEGEETTQGLPFGSQHILLIGPSGCGKTYLVQLIAELLNVPYSFISAASLVPAGCLHGTSINDLVESHYLHSGKDINQAQRGIIFIDEIDKIRLWGETKHDAFIEGVQDALLTTLDGCSVSVSSTGQRYLPIAPKIDIDTTGILFICAGAFARLPEIIRTRLSQGKKNSIGFSINEVDEATERRSLSDAEVLKSVETEDLVNFGLLPELIGRFATISVLDALTSEDFSEILVSAKDSIFHKKKKLFACHGIELVVTKPALKAIATKALALKTGARALTRVFQDCLRDTEYQLPELAEAGVSQITINEETVEKGQPLFQYAPQQKTKLIRVQQLLEQDELGMWK